MNGLDYGKAFEYACLIEIFKSISSGGVLSATIREDGALAITKGKYDQLLIEEPNHAADLARAGKILAAILVKTEPKLYVAEQSSNREIILGIQSDALGIGGDVRDVIAIKTKNSGSDAWEVGISCKHNNEAVKHQRISPNIDFGSAWLGEPLMHEDFQALNGIFAKIDEDIAAGKKNWSEIEAKESRYYVPVLELILNKIQNSSDQGGLAKHLLQYLVGAKDFYKFIVYSEARTIHFQAFNFDGTLNLGLEGGGVPQLTVGRLRLPTRIINCGLRPGSETTLEIFFDKGWQISMRVHNASTKLEKSLKMDVRLTGMPPELFTLNQNI